MVSRAHRLRSDIDTLVHAEWRTLNPNGSRPVLGMHMRGTDKASNRRVVTPAEFEPYVRSFFKAFPEGRAFVATESGAYAKAVTGEWRSRYGADRILIRSIGTRIDGKRSNAMTYRSRQHEVMMDVFLDIQMLARCDYFLRESAASPRSRTHSPCALPVLLLLPS